MDFKGDSVPSVILYVIAIRMFGQCKYSIDPDSSQIKFNGKLKTINARSVRTAMETRVFKRNVNNRVHRFRNQ